MQKESKSAEEFNKKQKNLANSLRSKKENGLQALRYIASFKDQNMRSVLIIAVEVVEVSWNSKALFGELYSSIFLR